MPNNNLSVEQIKKLANDIRGQYEITIAPAFGNVAGQGSHTVNTRPRPHNSL